MNYRILLSPAKKLNEAPSRGVLEEDASLVATISAFASQTKRIVERVKMLSKDEISALMHLSEKLTLLNYERYQSLSHPPSSASAKEAIFMYQGDVYDGLDAASLDEGALEFAQTHLRILSGLYGLLRPFDVIAPHRLEMGTKLNVGNYQNLYQCWKGVLTDALQQEAPDAIINLASNEYSKAVDLKALGCRVIVPGFKDYRNGTYRSLMMYVKRARGQMLREILIRRPQTLEELQSYDIGGYRYNAELSKGDSWLFTR